jgi:hypothetical protein
LFPEPEQYGFFLDLFQFVSSETFAPCNASAQAFGLQEERKQTEVFLQSICEELLLQSFCEELIVVTHGIQQWLRSYSA